MSPRRLWIPIAAKLALLAGIPVVGTIILAMMLVREAQDQATRAEALGTLEDLATLSINITQLVQELQSERASTSLVLATDEPELETLEISRRRTSAALDRLESFVESRNARQLPPRLSRDVNMARKRLAELPGLRERVDRRALGLEELLAYFNETDQGLIRATAGLTQLSDDGEMLRAITNLVSVLEVKERLSREQALLVHVFALGRFPPGSYKALVQLVTETEVHGEVLRSNGTEEQLARFQRVMTGPDMTQALAMRMAALATIEDDDFGVSATQWNQVQGRVVDDLRSLEIELTRQARAAAAVKAASIQRSVRLGFWVSGSVVAVSFILAALIGHKIRRSVRALSDAARRVREQEEYSVRVQRLSRDELGGLADAFNQMLAGIQDRDRELAKHRENLERLVEERTRQLAARNEEIQLILDTIDQGLAMVEHDGTLGSGCSAAFKATFPAPPGPEFFGGVLAQGDPDMEGCLKLGWDAIQEDFLPLEVNLEQMPKRIARNGRQYALSYKPVVKDNGLVCMLLIVTDVTSEIEREIAETEQKELVSVFGCIMRDRTGFVEFFNEASTIVNDLMASTQLPIEVIKRQIHTLKGNCRLFGVASMARACHEFETRTEEQTQMERIAALPQLEKVWEAFARRIMHLMAGEAQDTIELCEHELKQLEAAVCANMPPHLLLERLRCLRYEPLRTRFARIAQQASEIARRLGKTVEVKTEPHDVRLPLDQWAGFWAVFVHVIRNAIDHGMEPPEIRVLAGKPKAGQLTLSAVQDARQLCIELRDDGPGIDWTRVGQRAQALGLSHTSQSNWIESLFADGVTTKDQATETSGRGVGLGAVRAVWQAMGGRVTVTSIPGRGTTFGFVISTPVQSASNDRCSSRPVLRPASSINAPMTATPRVKTPDLDTVPKIS